MSHLPTRSVRRNVGFAIGLGLLTLGLSIAGVLSLPQRQTALANPPAAAISAPPKSPLSEGLIRLRDGNARFVSGRMEHPRQSPERRTELANTQKPFAVILGCADSRTPPEVLFDQGLGDLFIVRVAGNVLDDQALGSVEYAAAHLHAPLVIVLGHKRCGAIVAAREVIASGGHAEGHIESLVTALRPAVEATLKESVEETCKANVRNVVNAMRESKPILADMVTAGKLKVVGAYYDLDTGVVTLVESGQ